MSARKLGKAVAEQAASVVRHPGCVVCGAVEAAEASFLRWFVHEGRTDSELLVGARASLGFCPAHTRALLAIPDAPILLPALWAAVLDAAVGRLIGARRGLQVCPLCQIGSQAESRVTATLVDSLAGRSVRATFEASDALCLAHLEQALAQPGAPRNWLGAAGIAQAVPPNLDRVVGVNGDREARRRLWARRRRRIEPAMTVAQRWWADLDDGACPICAASAAAESHVLVGLSPDREGVGSSRRLCPTHLRDLADIDADLAELEAAVVLANAVEALRAMDGVQPDRRQLPQNPLGSVGPGQLACPACHAAKRAECDGLVLVRMVSGDPSASARYRRTTGLCVRHTLSLDLTSPEGLMAIPLSLVKLAGLSSQLEQARRRHARPAGSEATGCEQTAWRRAPAAVDGAVFLGLAPGRVPARRCRDGWRFG